MVKSVYVPEAGGILDFADDITPEEISSYINTRYPRVKAPAAPAQTSDNSGILDRIAYGLGTGITDIPGGIAALMYPAEEASQTMGGRFSESARKYFEGNLNIDPTKEPTTAQMLAQGLGSAASFLIPGGAAAKGASLAGAGVRGAARLGTATAAAQGVAVGTESRAEQIRQQLGSGMEISEGDQLAAQRLSGLIGASEALPMNKFFGPLNTILSKIPASKAPIVEKIISNRLAKITKASIEEAAQEVASGIANDVMEYGVYNPNVQIGQDLLSNAGTGAFAGGFLEGVIQLAAGRKLRGVNQLRKDLAEESKQSSADLRQASVTQAAEALRSANAEGDLTLDQLETPEGFTSFTLNKDGKPIIEVNSEEEASQAIDLYKQMTGAKVSLSGTEKPRLDPVRVGNRRFANVEAVQKERDRLKAEVANLDRYYTNIEQVSKDAATQGVSPGDYAKQIDQTLNARRRELSMFDRFFSTEPVEVSIPEGTSEVQKPAVSVTVPEAAPEIAEADIEVQGPVVSPEVARTEYTEEIPAEVPEPIVAEEQVPEMPIGAVEMPVEESRVLPDTVVDDEYVPEDIPEPAPVKTEQRPSATVDDLAALQTELFGEPKNVNDMTPEELAVYTVERDKRFPPQDVDVYYDAAPLNEPAPRNLREAILSGPTVRDYTPETERWIKGVYQQLGNRLKGIIPEGAELNFKTLIDAPAGYLSRGKFRLQDSPDGMKGIIDLATGILRPGMTVEQAVNKLVDTVNHEIMHVLKAKGVIRESEWRILERAVEFTNVSNKSYTYLDKAESVYTPNGVPISPEYADPAVVREEAIAELYKDWVRQQMAPPPTRGIFNRITEFFRRIFQTLRNARYDDIFKQIESGEVGLREAVEPIPDSSQLFSAAPAVDSAEFKRWFGNSKAVNPDGTPTRYYHGTPFSFDKFGRARSGAHKSLGSGPFFFSTSTKFANDYAMTKMHKGGYGAPVKSGGRVIPVYLSVQNPFDYENPAHIEAMARAMAVRRNLSDEVVDKFVSDWQRQLSDGFWQEVERPDVQQAIKDSGFDGFYLNESGFKNLAVFKPEQVKSVFNQFEEGAAESKRFSAAPLPPYIERQNESLFAPAPQISYRDMMFDWFFGHRNTGKTLNTMNGVVDISKGTMAGLSAKSAVVDKNAYLTHLESLLNEQQTGNFQRMQADYSATAALAWRRRSGHLTASMMLRGKLEINFERPGDIQSATMKVTDDPDSLKEVFKVLTEPGPDKADGTKTTKADIFKSYAVALRGEWLRSTGQAVPAAITPQYIRETIAFTRREYPDVVEAYNKYQRFNKNLLTAAKDAGIISQAELGRLTNQMNYYGFIYEAYGEPLGPSSSQKTASKFKLRPYTGTQYGGLTNDPMFVMIQNAQFWVDSIAKNLAATKAYNVAHMMGEARPLLSDEKPDEAQGEAKDVMYYSENGVVKKFAVKDPLLVAALGSDDRIDVGKFWQVLGVPAHVLRESVTRDPAFMARNLLRDTVAAWMNSGVDFVPVIDTLKGFNTALKNGASFQALSARGVVGSYDLAMMGPDEIAETFRRNAMPLNVHTVASVKGGSAAIRSLWNRLGTLSEASDAATRIAVYDALKAQGMTDAEAAMQAIELLDFTRRGGSQTLGILTKLIPFLNARIQGMDVLYQAGRAGIRSASGGSRGERDANLGKKFLVRGGMLAALSVALEMLNEDDEDYKQLDNYIKEGNLLIPLKEFGLEGQFLAIPKPFENGLLFSTIPQQIYKTMAGDASMRDNVNLFFGQMSSTFGVNPIPQALLPPIEMITNHNFYTGLPLISEGKARLAPELQYNTSTSQIAIMLGSLPIYYDFTTGRFGGMSPIMIDKIISGYGGPIGTYLVQATSLAMQDAQLGPERMPVELSNMPVVRSFFIDAKTKNPKVVTQAYELFRIADEANRTVSRLKQMGDAEALMDYVSKNRDILTYKKYIFALTDRLNKLSAQERAVERDSSMTDAQKIEAQRQLREIRIRLSAQVFDINQKLGR